VDENRLKRCLKGVIRGEGWISTLLGGGGFLLVSQVCVTSFVSGKWRRTRRGNGIRRNQESLHLSSDVSVMEETIQSLPQELRTLQPKRWSTENVFGVTGWGFSFNTAGGTLLQNGVDGRTIHDALSDTSQTPVGDVTSLSGELIHKHVYVLVACPLSFSLMPKHAGPMGITNGQVLRFRKERRIFSALCSYFDKMQEPQAPLLALLVIERIFFNNNRCC